MGKVEILFEDEHLLVAAKPAGMLSVGTPNARGRTLADALGEQGLAAAPVHRLDREVSGALLCARDRPTREALETLFRERRMAKTYWALARGHLRTEVGEIKFPILEERSYARVSAAGKPSLTRYRTLSRFARTSELEIDLVTGRYNQIRLHLAHSGHPLVGERKYARGRDDPLEARRIALHAWRLAFAHPRTGQRIALEAPLPPELAELRERAARQ